MEPRAGVVENEVETVEMENKYIRLLQFLVGTEVDGDFGPKSRAAADQLLETLAQMYSELKSMIRPKEEK